MEATPDSARTSGKGSNPRGRYYLPAASIEATDGVQKECRNHWTDQYTGTAEALAASGIIALELMPGQPGAPTFSAAYRPQGVPKSPDGWYLTPGYIEVFRSAAGHLRVRLTVSAEEQARREAAQRAKYEQTRREQDTRSPAALTLSPAELAAHLADLLNAVDEATLRLARERLNTLAAAPDSRRARDALAKLLQPHGPQSVIRNHSESPHERPRRPAADHLRLVWTASA